LGIVTPSIKLFLGGKNRMNDELEMDDELRLDQVFELIKAFIDRSMNKVHGSYVSSEPVSPPKRQFTKRRLKNRRSSWAEDLSGFVSVEERTRFYN